jgi:hypothetical protein
MHVQLRFYLSVIISTVKRVLQSKFQSYQQAYELS